MAENQQDMEEFEFPDEIEEKKAPEPEVEAKSDLDIEIEDDTPPADRDRKNLHPSVVKELEETELDKYQDDAKDKLKQLKKVWHDERRAKEAALREQQEAIRITKRVMDENKNLKERLFNGETAYVDTVKQATAREMDMAKAEFKSAYESGDADKLLEAQEKMTAASLRMDKAQNYQPVYQKALQDEENDVQSNNQQVNAPDHKAVSWQKRNDWFGQDEEMTSLALGLHEKLVRSGVSAGSDEYYSRIDNTMRKRFPENFEDTNEDEPAKESRPKASTVVAPATRSTSPKKVRLSKTQVLLSKKLGLTPEQYARELTKLEAQNG
jgi:HPt (histidine-containing phosphotransfer) domain-containing protein